MKSYTVRVLISFRKEIKVKAVNPDKAEEKAIKLATKTVTIIGENISDCKVSRERTTIMWGNTKELEAMRKRK